MKILILGTGSIGMRHLKNCLTIDPSIQISVVSRSKNEIHVNHPVSIFKSINHAFSNTNFFDAVIVATPTTLHINNCLELLSLGVKKIYLEKPVSNNLENIDKLLELSIQNNAQIFVGFDLHFDLGLNKIKQLLVTNVIGTIVSFQSEVGQFLPDWRPNTNYKEGMSAKKSLGGGVMLDLIHEFDYLIWIFGSFKKIFGFNNSVNSLAIETEAISVNCIETFSGVLGTLSLDYLQKDMSRTLKIIGDKGTIFWNYVQSSVKWKTHSCTNWNEFSYQHIERNDRFLMIMKSFLDANQIQFDSKLTLLNEGIASLEAVVNAKKCNDLNRN